MIVSFSIARQGATAGKYSGLVVFGYFHFNRRGFLGSEPLRASIWGNGCMIAFVSTAGDFSAVSHCGQVGWHGRESLLASV